MRTHRRFAALAFAAAVVCGCSGATEATPGPTAGANPSATVGPATPAPSFAASQSAPPSKAPSLVVYDGRIDIGGGRKLEVRCVGHGSPTILLEGGGITPNLDEYPRAWVNDLGKKTTACHYSRAGGGTSSPLPTPLTMAGFVGDAYDLLGALETQTGIKGPYVFVGWSFGGTVALAEALEHPDRTAGLVILDTDFVKDFMKECIASARSKADCQAEYDGDVEAKSIEAELLPKVKPLPDIPLRIVSAMQLPDCDPSNPSSLTTSIAGRTVTAKDCASLAKEIALLQLHGWSTINPTIGQTTVDADHDGLIDEAGKLIAPIILDLVSAARTSS